MKNAVQRFCKLFGFELHRTDGRGTLGGALMQLKKNGFSPAFVIDGGASDGRWTLEAKKYFSSAHYILVEPLQEYQKVLAGIPKSEVVQAALADRVGTATFYASSAFNSSLNKNEHAEARTVPTITLDSLLEDPENTLVKLDLEETELPVLAASELLPRVGALILECAFTQLQTYGTFLQQKGFTVFQIFGASFRRSDGDMTQVDILFVPKDSDLLSTDQ